MAGIIFCLFYDILRALRKTADFSSIAVFFQDTVFSLFSAIVVFIFLLGVTNGEVRAYVLFGMLLGFLLCRMTISRIFKKILIFIFSNIKKIFSATVSGFYDCFEKSVETLTEFLKKSGKTLKKLLKKILKLCILKGSR